MPHVAWFVMLRPDRQLFTRVFRLTYTYITFARMVFPQNISDSTPQTRPSSSLCATRPALTVSLCTPGQAYTRLAGSATR